MIRQVFDIDGYWKVVVYYNVDYNLYDYIVEDLRSITTPVEKMYDIKRSMQTIAKAVTITSFKHKTSIVLFNKHKTIKDYIESIVHESYHITQALLDYYNVSNEGEPPAYTIGYIIRRMYDYFCTIISTCNET